MRKKSTVRRVLVLIFALALFAVVPGALATNGTGVINGGFESPIPDGSWDIFPEDEVPGWTIEWTDSDAACGGDREPLLEIQKSGTVVAAFEGSQYAELDTDCQPTADVATNVRISQDLGLAAGHYSLEFAWQQRTNADRMLVNAGSESSTYGMDGNAQNGWAEDNIHFDADGVMTTISFEESDTPDNSLGMFLDGVCVTCIYLEFDLIAGQHEDVGSILVWNDDEGIFVKYMVDDPWMIEEIHLAIGATADDIPGNKGGPIPGKFPIKEYFDPLTSTAPVGMDAGYEVDFDNVLGGPVGPGDPVVIAAHAVVWNTDSEMTETAVNSRADVDVYGPSDKYLALGDLAWGDPVPAMETWKHPSWPMLAADPAAVWISDTEYIEGNIAGNTWRMFHDEFEAPGYPLEASVVTATADNAEVVYVNGVEVGSDGEIDGPFVDNHEWNTVKGYPLLPVMGMNDLDFIVRNYSGSASPTSNPTGLIYSVDVTYYDHEETAWGSDGVCELDGKNWALCLAYTIGDCERPVDVPS